jgi:hypothetical protein
MKMRGTLGLTNYMDAGEMTQAMRTLANTYPGISKVVNLNEIFNIPFTADGNSLYALHVSSTPGVVGNKYKMLFIGQHHARELMTHHAVYDSARSLLVGLSGNKSLAEDRLSNTSYWFVPIVNPDGLNFVFNGNNWWRKNRRSNRDGSFGVDLNRNYHFEWGTCGNNSSSTSSDIYKGPAPHSEPEVKAMDILNRVLKAQYVISYHSSGDEVLYPYVCHSKQSITDQSVYYSLRDRLARHLKFGMRHASSSGEDFEHHFNKHGSLSFLLELGRSFQPAFSIYQKRVLPNVLKVLPFLERELRSGFLEVQVVSRTTKKPISGVAIHIKELPLFQKELRVTDMFGTLRRKTSLNQLTMKLVKPGLRSKEIRVTLKRNANTKVLIEL